MKLCLKVAVSVVGAASVVLTSVPGASAATVPSPGPASRAAAQAAATRSAQVAAAAGTRLTKDSRARGAVARPTGTGWDAKCGMYTTAVGNNADHNMGLFYWHPGKVDFNDFWESFPLAQPQALAFVHGEAPAKDVWIADWVGIDRGSSRLYRFNEMGWFDSITGTVKTSHSVNLIGRGWGDTTFLAASGSYLYQVTSTGRLWRSDRNGRSRVRVIHRGLAGLRSFSYAASMGNYDTFLAVTNKGALVEYRVRRGKRATVSASVLKATGFQGYRYVTAGGCPAGARPIFAVAAKGGNVDVYRDGNPTDGSGKDITLSSHNVADWTNHFYG